MAVPNFEVFMLPLLMLANDRQVHMINESVEKLAKQMSLTDEDRKELTLGGTVNRLKNRVRWARTYLTKAGLLSSAGKSAFRITERGIDVLKQPNTRIDSKYLRRFPEFSEFKRPGTKSKVTDTGAMSELPLLVGEQTPDETLQSAYLALNQNLAEDLLEQVKGCTPDFFEKIVLDLLVAMGYGGSKGDAAQGIGGPGDEGVDGVIKEDRLGLDMVYVQAKKWANVVGRPTLQAFAGSLDGQRARKGVFITTSQFTQEAKDYVNRIEKRIVLIDGEQLAQYMIDFGVGVTEVATYIVKKVDLDYFVD
jgi:restriction system protein